MKAADAPLRSWVRQYLIHKRGRSNSSQQKWADGEYDVVELGL